MANLSELTIQGKHIDLVPQTRVQRRQITISRGGTSVTWGPGVKFGPGVTLAGAPVDPSTQRIVPTPGVFEEVVTWVSFKIEGYKIDAEVFATNACSTTREIAQRMTNTFDL